MSTLVLAAQAAQGGGMGGMLLMMVAIFAIMWFFMVRPQQKKQKKIREFQNSLQDGSRVVTGGGIYGTVKRTDQAKNIIEGYPDGTFKPDATVNRAEILKIILGGSGVNAKEGVTVSPFPDVPASAWFGGWVDAAKDRKIVSGNPDGSFEPSTTVNKAAALKILLLTNNVDLSSMTVSSAPFADVLADDWFALYFQYAKDKNLLEADSSNKILPSAGMTRGEVAEIIYRLMRIKETGAASYSATSNT